MKILAFEIRILSALLYEKMETFDKIEAMTTIKHNDTKMKCDFQYIHACNEFKTTLVELFRERTAFWISMHRLSMHQLGKQL